MKQLLIESKQITAILADPSCCCTFNEYQWETLIRVLRHEGLLARISVQLQQQGLLDALPPYAQKHLHNAAVLAENQHSSIVFECQQIRKSTQQHGVRFYLLKGAAYVFCGNNTNCGRTFGDIDLLVNKSQINVVENTLLLHGWLADDIDDYDNAYYRNWAHEIPPLKHTGRGSVIDLHHNLVPVVSGRAPKIEYFTDNAIEYDGFFVLAPAAMTLHSIVHLFINEDFKHGLRDLNDIHLLFTEYASEGFWHELDNLASKCGFTLELYLACRYSHRFFQTKIPSEFASKLAQCHGNRLVNLLRDFIFSRVLASKHPLYTRWSNSLAATMALVRGHYLKMPWPILIRHTVHKSYRMTVRLLLGKSFFTKEQNS
ncbi:nucleotidyltransferase domain-containing protein [Thalassotalea sp. ND16A]|uniref:nucleotidyltransferase domain-containing protein n=1 Tax=Thalassotalea sp. ND16A TaxID=1535422 RepID=UPI00051DC9AA|nr:nucleotidyltransferase family protein [Thalassotalea sp. ND16A]KGJ88160.1 hypothetical protein ND16A_2713 [Thalassotalea sp. ND16A]